MNAAWWRRCVCWLACLGFVGAGAAAEVSAADAKRVRAVIQAQLDAFAHDDAVKAYAHATPALREEIGSAERFMGLVRTNYPVVYRPASVAFLKPAWNDGVLVQGVHMTDEQGVLWLALYQMQRQRDKSWRIAGCVVVAQSGRVT